MYTMTSRLFSSFIVKVKNPCITCINYIPYRYSDPYLEIEDSRVIPGKCSVFGKQHYVTGFVERDDALLCRLNENQCGKEGKHYLDILEFEKKLIK